jgi:hypothetical protein
METLRFHKENNMKLLFSLLALCLVTLSACVPRTLVQGSGNIVTESRPVTNFDKISLSGAGDLNITQGDTESLTIEADDNLLPYIETTVQNGTLIIGLRDDVANVFAFRPTRGIKYNVGVINLSQVLVSGAGNVNIPALKTTNLALRTTGAGNSNLADLEASNLTVDITGAGNIVLAGAVEMQEASLSGFGNYNAGDLSSTRANVSISGAGNATVWVTQSLDARISGAGSVTYYGSPQVTQSVSGVGTIRNGGEK